VKMSLSPKSVVRSPKSTNRLKNST